MSYTPTEWEPTDVVTATRMNALETAVGEMNMSYTPNTWSDGDILSADKMNALEQAVASGGGSWTVLTEESVTTEQRGLGVVGNFAYSERITADTIKVAFNGTEYTCTKTVDADTNHYGAEWSDGYDFSTYPFAIDSNSDLGNAIFTETAGTYSIKIEAPAESGSSDFSTAQVTIVSGPSRSLGCANAFDDGEDTGSTGSVGVSANSTEVVSVILYKGVAWVSSSDAAIVSVSGSAEKLGSSMVMVTGDCTITIS